MSLTPLPCFATGDNTLIGGRGRDVLTGGGGADTFMLLEEDSVDYISDLGTANDYRIDWLNGGSGYGTAGDNQMIVPAGQTTVNPGRGNDTVTLGGDGTIEDFGRLLDTRESRRWRHGERGSRAANNNEWRRSA